MQIPKILFDREGSYKGWDDQNNTFKHMIYLRCMSLYPTSTFDDPTPRLLLNICPNEDLFYKRVPYFNNPESLLTQIGEDTYEVEIFWGSYNESSKSEKFQKITYIPAGSAVVSSYIPSNDLKAAFIPIDSAYEALANQLSLIRLKKADADILYDNRKVIGAEVTTRNNMTHVNLIFWTHVDKETLNYRKYILNREGYEFKPISGILDICDEYEFSFDQFLDDFKEIFFKKVTTLL